MRILVVGGTGLIGSRVIEQLGAVGHDARPASPSSGVDVISGVGLDGAMKGVDIVVDVTNPPGRSDDEVMTFFTCSTSHQLAAERRAGVRHHVALSIVGAHDLPDSGYMRAKVAQEAMISAGGVPHTILRSTQFYEFIPRIAESHAVAGRIHLPPAPFKPVAVEDVATTLVELVTKGPVNGVVMLSGPELSTLATATARVLAARGDTREVVADPSARYFGADISGGQLVPSDEGSIGQTALGQWLGARPERTSDA